MTVSVDDLLAVSGRGALRRPFVIATTPALATGAYITVRTGLPNMHWFVRRLRLQQDSGDTTTWNVRAAGASTFADAAAYFQLRDTDTEMSTATPINESIEQDDGWIVSDATGNVYLKVTFGSGTNHVLSGSGMLEPIDVMVDG